MQQVTYRRTAGTGAAGVRFRKDGLIDTQFENGFNYDPLQGGPKYESSLLEIVNDGLEGASDFTLRGQYFNIFEDIYEKVGNPIKIDTIDKWKLYFENNYKYCDDIENKPNNPIDNFRCMISNGGYDILWKVKKIKQITLEKKNLSSLPYRSRISKISIDNKNYSLIEKLIKGL